METHESEVKLQEVQQARHLLATTLPHRAVRKQVSKGNAPRLHCHRIEGKRDFKVGPCVAQEKRKQELERQARHLPRKQEARAAREALLDELRSELKTSMDAKAAWKLSCGEGEREPAKAELAEIMASKAAKEAAWKLSRAEGERELAKAEVAQLKSVLEAERLAATSLIRQHNAEVRSLKEQLRTSSCEANRELFNRSIREQAKNRRIRLEAEKTFKLLEQEFRAALAEKEQALQQLRDDTQATQTALQAKLKEALKASAAVSKRAAQQAGQELMSLRLRNKQLEKQLQKSKPQPPLKSAKVLTAYREKRLHVKRNARQPQEDEVTVNSDPEAHPNVPDALKVELNTHSGSTNEAIENLKAIDADIERLRWQIEDRDRTIVRQHQLLQMLLPQDENQKQLDVLNEEVLHNQCLENGTTSHKLVKEVPQQSEALAKEVPSLRQASRVSEVQTMKEREASLVMEVQKLKEREASLATEVQKLNEREASLVKEVQSLGEREASLVMEVQSFKEREASLVMEVANLREQCDLLEFRTVELEECRPSDAIRPVWCPREAEDLSDSGVMSLPTSDDLTSEQMDLCTPTKSTETKLTGVATVFSSVDRPRSLNKSCECLEESGIFEDGDISRSGNIVTCVSDAIAFYEARLSQLQDKLDIYQSSGGERERLLHRRLEKELLLTCEVRRLNQRLTRIARRNQVLEEERCEFEEAENDSRLECQRLESQLAHLLDTKVQLETEVASLREARKKRRKNDVAETVAQLQQELAHLKQKSKEDKKLIKDLKAQLDEKEDKMAALIQLKLEASAADAQAISQQLGLGQDSLPGDEAALRETIATLQNTNQAFIKALSDADHIWATMEQEYQQRLIDMEAQYEVKLANADTEIQRLSGEMRRISQLEKKVVELTMELSHKHTEVSDLEVTTSELREEVDTLEKNLMMWRAKGLSSA